MTTNHDDIVKRLTEGRRRELPLLAEAAAEITRLRAEAEALRQALQQLIEYADTSDDCQYGTLGTSLVKDIANAAIDATKGTT